MQALKPGFRWYGDGDEVPLEFIAQSGAESVFTSLHYIPYGEVWSAEEIRARRDKVAEYGLKALFAKRAVATCGFTNKMLTVAAQLAPRFLTRMVSRAMLDQLNRPPKKEDKKPEQSA